MNALQASIATLGGSQDWLITANFILSVLLGMWMLRFRKLYNVSRETEQNNAALIENLSEGIYRSSPDGRQLSANRALVKLNGYGSEAEMLAGITDIGIEWYVEPGRRDVFREILHREGKVEDFVSEVYRHKTRERIWISESARLVYDKRTGRELFYEGSVREITETVSKLRFEEQFQKLTQRLPVGLFHFVRREGGLHEVLLLSESASRITGIPVAEQIAMPGAFSSLVVEEDLARYHDSLLRSVGGLHAWECEFRIRARDGVEKWVHINAHTEAMNGDINWYGYIADVSARKRQDQEIERLAYFDPLTKLPNRRMFLDRMARAISECEQRQHTGALLFIDLDHFKTLNDTLGHDVGDELLVQVAGRLLSCVGGQDMVARIGGDEFVVVLASHGGDQGHAALGAITTANRILAELGRGFELTTGRHVCSASIGVVRFEAGGQRPEEILKQADLAMYQAKSAGRNGVSLYNPETMAKVADGFRLVSDLRPVIERDELELYYQPQADGAGRIVGAEALLRWNHPTRGLVCPEQFIPMAEHHGMSEDLTRFVMTSGLRTLSAWQRDPVMRRLGLSINVGANAFSSGGFGMLVRRLIAEHRIDPTRLTIELTEHVMAHDPVEVARRMQDLKTLGLRFSLDDFGTGYSSFAHLKRLPFDEVKIDGSFVRDIETSDKDRALLKMVLAMGRTLNLRTVAEHVEDQRQEAFLRTFGCDVLQGHLYGAAMPLADLVTRVAEINLAHNEQIAV